MPERSLAAVENEVPLYTLLPSCVQAKYLKVARGGTRAKGVSVAQTSFIRIERPKHSKHSLLRGGHQTASDETAT